MPGQNPLAAKYIIQDGASYHTSKAMKNFFDSKAYRLTVYDLPSYSSDYNPIEKLWKKIKEKEIHLQYFPSGYVHGDPGKIRWVSG